MGHIVGKPSPAMVVSVIALSFAVAGSAVAGTALLKLDKSEKKQVKKIARTEATKQINASAPGLAVANAQNAVSAQTATVGAPAAYAAIAANGSVDPRVPSREITSATVDNPGTGRYCFDLAFAPKTASVTPAIADDLADDAILSYTLEPDEYIACPASAEAEVANLDGSDAFALQNDAFNVQFDG